jgi:hypothetical protein
MSLEQFMSTLTWAGGVEPGTEHDDEEREATLNRIVRMVEGGFHAPTQTGGTTEDREWYLRQRQHIGTSLIEEETALQEFTEYLIRMKTPEEGSDVENERQYREWAHNQDDTHDYDACDDSECEHDHIAYGLSKN